MSSLADMCSQAAAAGCREPSWHMQLTATGRAVNKPPVRAFVYSTMRVGVHALFYFAVTHFSRYSGVIEGEIIRKKKQGSVNIVLPHSIEIRPNIATCCFILLLKFLQIF